jgi:hypothetical protein
VKVLLVFMFLSFAVGVFWEHRAARIYVLPLIALGLFVMFSYFFLDQT